MGARRGGIAAVATLAAVVSLGCDGGGSSEPELLLTLRLPAASTPDDPLYVGTQIRSQDAPFGEAWEPRGDEVPAIALEAEPRSEDHLVQRKDVGGEAAWALNVKVRFCEDPECASVHSAQWLHLRRAFFEGAHTEYTHTIETIPAIVPMDPLTVEKCAIEGCADEPMSSYCDEEGRHFCETGG